MGLADLVVMSNRLPVHLEDDAGQPCWKPSPGGLVSALTPVLRARGGTWIGWSGRIDREPVDCASVDGAGAELRIPESYEDIALRAVPISAQEYEDFYVGFSNRTLWPLYHDAIRTSKFDRTWWQSYVTVNHRYADAAAAAAGPGATVWVHDYHLQLVPMMLRARRPDVRIGFFMHIPFPPQELFVRLPWRREIMEGLLGADLIGFQVPGAAKNFGRLARSLTDTTGTNGVLHHDGRTIRVGAFPISIDTAEIVRRATNPKVIERAREIRSDLGAPKFVLLGVDRLDYTKGIHQRLEAVAELFAEGTLATPQHAMVQIAVPSREEDSHYQQARDDLERLVGEVNGTYSQVGHPAIHYLHQSVDLDELIALYLVADVMLVTPLRDGMNLVAKEYVASRVDGTGALVLSEFAGAARELDRAVLVNPHDVDGIKDAIRAVLDLDPAQAASRMRSLRRVVQRRDVHAWALDFLTALREPLPLESAERPRSTNLTPVPAEAPGFEPAA